MNNDESSYFEQDWQEHECSNIPEDVSILLSREFLPSGKKKWSLNISRTATAEDLEQNNYFEEEGETVWEASVEILYCPYCGERLAKEAVEADEDYGERRNVSHAKWNIEVL